MSGLATGRSVSKYERSGKNGRFIAPGRVAPDHPEVAVLLELERLVGRSSPSIRRRMAPSPPTPGLPSQEKTSLRATPAAIIWS